MANSLALAQSPQVKPARKRDDLNQAGECSDLVIRRERPATVAISIAVARPTRPYPDVARKAEISLRIADHDVIGTWTSAKEPNDAPIKDIGIRLGRLTWFVCENVMNAFSQPESSERRYYRRSPFVAQNHDADAHGLQPTERRLDTIVKTGSRDI
jgi:hypothetical protein